MQSNIFTEAEHKSLKDRLKGSKEDKTGIFSARVKPKIVEMLEYWFPQKKHLQKLVAPASRTNKKKEATAFLPHLKSVGIPPKVLLRNIEKLD